MLALKIAVVLGLVSFSMPLAAMRQTQSATAKADDTISPESLVGRYMIVEGEKEGAKEPDDRIKGTMVTFTRETVVVADKDKKDIYSASYKLDTTTNPCAITMTSRVEGTAGEIARGLIKKDGEVVQLIYALPTGEIPVAFKTKEKQLMFVMKRTD